MEVKRLKSIYQFKDFKEFLLHYYEYNKVHSKGFTLQSFSKKASLGSPNYLQLVFKGRRNLTNKKIHIFAKVIGFSEDEHRYFETLVHLNQSESIEEKRFYQRRLREMQKKKPKTGEKSQGSEILGAWYFPAVLVLAHKKKIKGLESYISEKLNLSNTLVKEALGYLKAIGELKVVKEKYLLNEDHITSEDRASRSRIYKSYLKSQMEKSFEALDQKYEKNGKFFSHTFTMNKDRLQEYSDRIQSLIEDLTEEADTEKSSDICQLNLQMFILGK